MWIKIVCNYGYNAKKDKARIIDKAERLWTINNP